MSLPFKPHTVTVYAASQAKTATGSPKQVVTWSETGVDVSGMVYPMPPAVAFEQTGVEVKNPYGFLFEKEDAVTFHVNDKVLWNGVTFFAHLPGKPFDVGLPADHGFIVLGQSQYANP